MMLPVNGHIAASTVAAANTAAARHTHTQLAYSCSCEAYRCTRKATEATAMLDLSRAAIEGVSIDAHELTPRQLPMQSEG